MKNATDVSDPRVGTFTVMLETEEAQLLLETIKTFTVNPEGAASITSMEFIDPPEADGSNGTLLVTINNDGDFSTLAVPAQYGIFTEENSDIYMLQGTWRDGTLEEIASQNPNKDPTYSFSGTLGTFVYGIATTQAELDGFVGGLGEDMTATYTGATGFGASASLDINFSTSTWSGSFNGGIDGDLQFGPSGDVVIGELGFTASGDIIGTNLISNSISADDLNVNFGNQNFVRDISGEVNASFYGSDAQGIGGSAEITKQFYDKQGNTITSFDADHITTFAVERE